MKEEEYVAAYIPNYVLVDKVVGVNYQKGGYAVIENLLGLGIGLENASSIKNKANISSVLDLGKKIVSKKLESHKSMIEKIIDSSSSSLKSEEEISKILFDILK